MAEPIVMSWSGGKDSALALHRLIQSAEYEVKYLLTTLNANYRRISMHGIREELLDTQAASIGIPLVKIWVSEGSEEEYERQMKAALLKFHEEGIRKVAFGDIFLEDLRAYRDANLAKVKMQGIYPLWKEPTYRLINEFLDLNFRTITCCISTQLLTKSKAGQIIDKQFVKSLPNQVDVCGENGEFHTFVFDGPIFSKPLQIEAGKKVFKPLAIKMKNGKEEEPKKEGFWYSDIKLVN